MLGPLPDRKAPENGPFDPLGGTVIREIVEEPASGALMFHRVNLVCNEHILVPLITLF